LTRGFAEEKIFPRKKKIQSTATGSKSTAFTIATTTTIATTITTTITTALCHIRAYSHLRTLSVKPWEILLPKDINNPRSATSLGASGNS
jgi:hypothetical protein